ncbi:hypothetical protein NQ317_003891 [Molorchus minor]|uniref:THAP-type domain-containing protein n=1 Tax=Molorchus minor TaxID=1323400 RepID=A0ABQ9IRX7_9CUCU|nr:hypothetical protein NQ317_003891 [Molorchus minor]
MPSFCAVVDALSKERGESWVRALKRGNLSDTFLNNARICANHFVSGEPAKLEDKDNPDWVPSVNMGYITTKTQDEQSVKRHDCGLVKQTELQTNQNRELCNQRQIGRVHTKNNNTSTSSLPASLGKNSCVFYGL